ncbi:MAG: imidazole glycerol phosphate synthase subunit HisH [Fimbriimonadaceae bacterium]|nr:imidazole glycerol phosphate synthase subunit HisH [Fimbriimonadaceae bacterium]
MISILDYGMGNLRSVQKAFEYLGEEVEIVTSLSRVSRLVIPGVGAFGAAMERLSGFKRDIQSFAAGGQPILGICLGQQLLFETSEEHGSHAGLEIIGGSVKYFSTDLNLKVPHIGWSPIQCLSAKMGRGLDSASEVYFVHSLYTECSNPSDIAIESEYGIKFAAAIERNNVWGMQFHPEKSSQVGLQLLKNWSELC